MIQANQTASSARTPKSHFFKMSLVAFLAILAFGFLTAGPRTDDAAMKEVIAGDSGSSSITLTSPSAMPNIKIKNFGQMDEYFFRGAQPKPDDYKSLALLGIKTIIDLRDDPTEYEKPNAEAAGMKYVNIPMSDKSKPSEDQVAAFFAVANDPFSAPFYVHCVGGRHRTGLIGAVYRFNKYGWDYDQAYREMKNYDYYSRWGHGAIKEYVREYYERVKPIKAVLPVVATEADSSTSEPVTPPPPPKPKE